jgi:uncharacterized protein (TIGR03083 family)
MQKIQARELVRQERTDLLTFLERLTPSEWEVDSLCAGWRVRDVVAHIVAYDTLAPSLGWQFVRSTFSVDRLNVRVADAWRKRNIDELVGRLRANLIPGGITRLIGWPVALQEAVVHHQDIRRPLGHIRKVPSERVVAVLECLIDPPFLAALPKRATDLRLDAADIGWQWGDGAIVTGTGEAIMLALAGRQCVLDELSGPGVSTLRSRI